MEHGAPGWDLWGRFLEVAPPGKAFEDKEALVRGQNVDPAPQAKQKHVTGMKERGVNT